MQRRLVSVPVDHVKMNICHRGEIMKNAAARKNVQLLFMSALSPVILHRLFLWWFGLWKIIRNAAQRIKMLLFSPKCSRSLNCYWLGRQDPLVSYLPCFSIICWAISNSNLLKGISSFYSSHSLSPHFSSVLPSFSPTSGSARKEHSVVAPWRENGRIHPTLRRW